MPPAPTKALVLAIVALAATGCEREVQQVSLTRDKMSTLVRITVFDRSPQHAQKAIDAAFDRIDRIVALADRRRPDSEVARLAKATQPLRVSPEIWRLLKAAQSMSQQTGGAFDVTVGPLCVLWKTCGQRNQPPTDAELAAALKLVGSDGIVFDEANRTVALSRPGMMLDLGAVAKGYTVDVALAALQKHGIASALVDAGGDMRMIGPRPGAKGWRIGVQDPRKPGNPTALVCTLQLPARAVATSGNYQRYSEIAGKRYSHIIDARTGRPCERVPSVTIVSRSDAMTADMWATAASVLGPDETLKRLPPGLEALLITIDDQGELHLRKSKGFDALVLEWRVGK